MSTFLSILFLIFSFCLKNNNAQITWTDSPITIPSPRSSQITAYDETSDLVWIIGGWSPGLYYSDIYSWNMTSDNFQYHGELSTGIIAMDLGQAWATIGNIIYFINQAIDNNIITFDMNSIGIVSNNIPLTPLSDKVECVASYHSNGNKYLIFMSITVATIYDFGTNTWAGTYSFFNQEREGFTCPVYKNYLYAIGGRYNGKTHLSSIEKIDINLIGILSSNWITLSNSLSFTTYLLRSTVVGDKILVAGGYNGAMLTKVNIISTVDDSVSIATNLIIPVSRCGIITRADKVLIIGGRRSDNSVKNNIQISSSFAATLPELQNVSFDEITFEDFGTSSQYVGWTKIYGCVEGTDMRFTSYDNSIIRQLVPYAISLKIVPDGSINNINYDNYSVVAKPCSHPILALNNNKELSWSINTINGQVIGFSDISNWIGSVEATTRLTNVYDGGCDDLTYPRDFLTEVIYHSCGKPGITLGRLWCRWVFGSIVGQNMSVYLGFDTNKAQHCNSTNFHYPTMTPTKSPTSAHPTSHPTTNPTANPTMDPTFDPTANPTHVPTYVPTYIPTANPTDNPRALPKPSESNKIYPTFGCWIAKP